MTEIHSPDWNRRVEALARYICHLQNTHIDPDALVAYGEPMRGPNHTTVIPQRPIPAWQTYWEIAGAALLWIDRNPA